MCDCDRDGPDFRVRKYLIRISSSDNMSQYGSYTRFEYLKCGLCGTVWYITVNMDNDDPGLHTYTKKRLSPEDAEIICEPEILPFVQEAVPAETFTGEWIDDSGRILKIFKEENNNLQADYIQMDGLYTERILLNGEKSPSKNMPAKITGNQLVIELGTPGLGPTLLLQADKNSAARSLIPQTGMGMYDDWEKDSGVPLVLPLSIFKFTGSTGK